MSIILSSIYVSVNNTRTNTNFFFLLCFYLFILFITLRMTPKPMKASKGDYLVYYVKKRAPYLLFVYVEQGRGTISF